MYEAKYHRDFSKRLLQCGLSDLDTFVAYFKWYLARADPARLLSG